MEYIRVADISELPANKMIMVVVGGKEVLLANVDGSYYAIANKCSHLGGSLVKRFFGGQHCYLPETWRSIRCKDRTSCCGGQDWVYKNESQG